MWVLPFQLKIVLSSNMRFYQSICSREWESHVSGEKWKTGNPPQKSYWIYFSFYSVSEDLGLSLERIVQVLFDTECNLILPASTNFTLVEFCPLQWHRSWVILFHFQWMRIVPITLFLELRGTFHHSTCSINIWCSSFRLFNSKRFGVLTFLLEMP